MAKNEKPVDGNKMKRFTIAAPKANKQDGVKLSIRTMPVSLLGGKITEAIKTVAEQTGKTPEMVRGVLTLYFKA